MCWQFGHRRGIARRFCPSIGDIITTERTEDTERSRCEISVLCVLCASVVKNRGSPRSDIRATYAASDEHVRRAALQLRLVEERIAHGVERLDYATFGQPPLHALAERVGMADGQLRRAAGAEIERIRRVDDHFAAEVVRFGEADRLLRANA